MEGVTQYEDQEHETARNVWQPIKSVYLTKIPMEKEKEFVGKRKLTLFILKVQKFSQQNNFKMKN